MRRPEEQDSRHPSRTQGAPRYKARPPTPQADTRLALQRSTGELASYQKKLIRIDDHLGVGIAGLTSDARVLSSVAPDVYCTFFPTCALT